tara:strand:+ start:543 stop:1610 length:1068 start_codon:yes stop_codon:yes gene_type:complete
MISKDRYLSPQKWDLMLKAFSHELPTTVIGHSVLNQPVYAHRLGSGSKRVLLWSQMHGNESTTTRALLDLFDHFYTPNGVKLLEGLTIMVIPQLNPDGALSYTRFNANYIDLNRDALNLSQPESRALKEVFDSFSPDFCFNLHGQRSIFAAGIMGKPATLSFLSPAANPQRNLTPARIQAMKLIAQVNRNLQKHIPNQIARYEDTFNPNCVGDHFTSLGVPTLLYEAGHNGLDYDRNFTKKMIFNALIFGLNAIENGEFLNHSIKEYHQIPENEKNYVDIIIKNFDIRTVNGFFKNQELAVVYQEEKKDESVFFMPVCHSFSKKIDLLAHRVINGDGILKASEIEFAEGKSIDIF